MIYSFQFFGVKHYTGKETLCLLNLITYGEHGYVNVYVNS